MPRNQPRLPGIDRGGAGGRPVARVRRGLDDTIKALRATGRLEKADAAVIALARTVADALDAEHLADDGSRYTVGALAGRLHPLVDDLRGIRELPLDEIDAALDAMRAAPLGDTPQP